MTNKIITDCVWCGRMSLLDQCDEILMLKKIHSPCSAKIICDSCIRKFNERVLSILLKETIHIKKLIEDHSLGVQRVYDEFMLLKAKAENK